MIKDAGKTHFGGNVWKSVAGNVIGVVGLLTIYVFLFGLQSLKKFEMEDVITIAHEESTINTPGDTFEQGHSSIRCIYLSAILIIAYNPLNGAGWKAAGVNVVGDTIISLCRDESGDKLIKCVEENVYMTNDILITDSHKFNMQPHYLDNYNGMAHELYPKPGVISKQLCVWH